MSRYYHGNCCACCAHLLRIVTTVDSNLHSPDRHLIELRMEHADLNATIDRLAEQSPMDELMMRRLKKRRLALRDQISRLEFEIDGKEPA